MDDTCKTQTFCNYKQAQNGQTTSLTSSNALKERRHFLPRKNAFVIKEFINSFY